MKKIILLSLSLVTFPMLYCMDLPEVLEGMSLQEAKKPTSFYEDAQTVLTLCENLPQAITQFKTHIHLDNLQQLQNDTAKLFDKTADLNALAHASQITVQLELKDMHYAAHLAHSMTTQLYCYEKSKLNTTDNSYKDACANTNHALDNLLTSMSKEYYVRWLREVANGTFSRPFNVWINNVNIMCDNLLRAIEQFKKLSSCDNARNIKHDTNQLRQHLFLVIRPLNANHNYVKQLKELEQRANTADLATHKLWYYLDEGWREETNISQEEYAAELKCSVDAIDKLHTHIVTVRPFLQKLIHWNLDHGFEPS